MMNSADVRQWPELDGPIVDKHSTGGVCDKVSAMQTRGIGMAVITLGGGRLSNEQDVDHSVGFDQIIHVGKPVILGILLPEFMLTLHKV